MTPSCSACGQGLRVLAQHRGEVITQGYPYRRQDGGTAVVCHACFVRLQDAWAAQRPTVCLTQDSGEDERGQALWWAEWVDATTGRRRGQVHRTTRAHLVADWEGRGYAVEVRPLPPAP